MSIPTDVQADHELAEDRPGAPIAIDFLPRGPYYAQFVVTPTTTPIRDADITIRFCSDSPDAVAGGDELLYERTFHRGYFDRPITFAPPAASSHDVGGMEIHELIGYYTRLEVEVRADERLSVATIPDLAAAWAALTEACIIEAIDPAQDVAERDRRQGEAIAQALAKYVAEPLANHANAVNSGLRQLMTSGGDRKTRWGSLSDDQVLALYHAVRASVDTSAELPHLAVSLRAECQARRIDPDPPEAEGAPS